MSAEATLRFPGWDLNQSKYEIIDTFPLMATTGPVLMILAAYLLFVKKIGPAMMHKREPFKLTTALVVYNAFQVLFSSYMVYRYSSFLLKHGLAPTKCNIDDENLRPEIIFSIWIYFAAKITELLDTVFFVLRKKYNQITFLHVYHHSIMMTSTFAYLKYAPSETVLFIGFLNSLVHVFMYTYYGLAALGPSVAKYIFWKKYMTTFQLVQFVCVFIHFIIAVNRSECASAKGVSTFIACNALVFLFLFSHFYRQNYIKKDKKANGEIGNSIEKKAA